MKKVVLFLIVTIACLTVNAEVPRRKMLKPGKMWIYTYHHFENENEDFWNSFYWLDGDTTIDGRQYMKMYRRSEMDYDEAYYGAFREDEEGRVYMYNYIGDKQDFKMFDTSTDIGFESPDSVITETIKENGQLFCRYQYLVRLPDGNFYERSIAVEGVGYQKYGIVHTALVEVDCLCDYEELADVQENSFYFSASAFLAPREIELTDCERQLIAGNNDFAFNLFRSVRGKTSSIISPLSITFALGMLNNGAAGQTLQEINQTLGFGDAGAEAINGFCRKMLTEAYTLDEKTKALISNTIFVNEGKGCTLQEGFIEKANEYYNAQPQSRDFFDGETMDVINQWANDHTEGMIPEAFDEDTFNPYSVSYLLNALYFKGAWSSPFDVEETKNEPFGGGPEIPMMNKYYSGLEYAENDLYQAVVLPYGNGAYQMSVFLPREGKSIGDVLEALNDKTWKVNGYTYDVDLKLPRIETESNINLVNPMSDLGMPSAFSYDSAEFPFFCDRQVYISNMFQMAKIKLDEQGTEAAAVTVIGMADGMPPYAQFRATRPFLYIISEQSTGAIFFIGQFTGGISVEDTNGISPIHESPFTIHNEADIMFDLSGRRVSSVSVQKGIYIQNGKVLVK